ncbi:hypothetical protein, partial [Cytobacillus praedii]|uniref:hypothetical protein n=1 Tax=Cytobacillus praedii TaxID=1742358 RepID=UPI002E22EFB8|nr:hypothetical protein [Cytobacillus praedii]
VLGDSVMSVLAYQDMNRITLYDMLKNEIEDTSNFTVEGFHYPGFHFGVFYTVLQFLVNTEKLPSIIILPINIRSFSPQWNMNPDYQYEKIIQKINSYLDSIQVSDDGLYGIDKEITYSKFIEYQSLYYRGIRELNSKFISWVNRRPLDENEFSKRYKEIFKWHYMYSLTKDNRKFLLLKKIIQIMKIQDTKILLYITPINYRAGAKYAGDDFIRALNRNLQLIKDYLNEDISANIHFCDFSKTLPETSFTHLNDTTEHLNENGRKLLASLILEKIKTLY